MTPADVSLVLLLLADLEQITPILAWPPAGNLADDVIAAARGHGGITAWEAQRLQRWARRWMHLDPRLRDFYARYAGHPSVSPVLWYLLDERQRPEARTIGIVHALFAEFRGFRGSLVVVPYLR